MFYNNKSFDRDYKDSKGVLELIHQRDVETLHDMYDLTENEIKEKYILFLDFEYYNPGYHNLTGDLILTYKSGEKYTMPTYKVRSPFPNKCWNVLSMRKGRKLSRRAIPLVFDSFEKLDEISHISCIWTTELGCEKFAISIISYDLNFIPSSEKINNIYSIISYDLPVYHLLFDYQMIFNDDRDSLEKRFNYLDSKYDTVALVFPESVDVIKANGILYKGHSVTEKKYPSLHLKVITRLLQLGDTSDFIAKLLKNNNCDKQGDLYGAYDFCEAKIDVHPFPDSRLLRIHY